MPRKNKKFFIVFVIATILAGLFPRGFSNAASIADLSDLNLDSCVNVSDFDMFRNVFGATTGQADINGDGHIDAKDMAYIMSTWTPTCTPHAIDLGETNPFGIEFARGYRAVIAGAWPKISTWQSMGAQWIKVGDIRWCEIEPNAPVSGQHTYYFETLSSPNCLNEGDTSHGLDDDVLPWLQAGFKVMLEFRSLNDWAMKPYVDENGDPYTPPLAHPGRPPKTENEVDYSAWVRAVVERYDGDGINDAPGLTAGKHISAFEIESEGTGDKRNLFYYATAPEYARQLQLAHDAIKAADSSAKIVLNGLNMRDLYAYNATTEQVNARMADLAGNPYYSTTDISTGIQWYKDVFDQGRGNYDIVENHELYTWRQLYGNMTRLKTDLQNLSSPINPSTLEFWEGDAISASPLTYLSGIDMNPAFGDPLSLDGYSGPRTGPFAQIQINAYLSGIINKNNAIYNCLYKKMQAEDDCSTVTNNNLIPPVLIAASHTSVVAWYRKLQSEEIVKKQIVGFDAGFTRVNMGLLENWPAYAEFPEEGFLEPNSQRSLSNLRIITQDGTPRPMYYTYQLLSQKMGNMLTIRRLDFQDANIYAYEVVKRDGARIYVAWLDDNQNQIPGETEPTQSIQFPSSSAKIHVTNIITVSGQTTPTTTDVNVVSGSAPLTLTKTPVIIEKTN